MTDSQRWFTLLLVLVGLVFIYFLGSVLVPFLVAFLLAYFLNPLVTKLGRLKVPHIVAVLLVFFVAILIVLLLLFMLIPGLEKQITVFIHKLPGIISWLETSVLPWINQKLHLNIQINSQTLKAAAIKHFHENGPGLTKAIMHAAFSSGHIIFEVIMNIILIPVITLYLLADWANVTLHGKRFLPFSAERKEIAVKLIRECGDVLAAFFRGQLLVMISLGIVYSIGLSLLGLDLALLIGVLAGVLSIVPYLGFIVGLLAAVIAAFVQFHSWWYLAGVLLVFGVGQSCESFIFSPLFVGDRIGLHPVAVIFAVLAGGKLFGFVGVLLALPAAAVIMVFIRYWRDNYFLEKQERGQGTV